jgi:hypothetical protein
VDVSILKERRMKMEKQIKELIDQNKELIDLVEQLHEKVGKLEEDVLMLHSIQDIIER